MIRRHAALLLALFLSACSESADEGPPPPATPERIQAVCEEWSRVGCEKNHECASEEDVARCVASGVPQCVYDVNVEAESCQANRLGAMERCSADLEAMTCDEYCGDDGFCFQYCPYFCPPT